MLAGRSAALPQRAMALTPVLPSSRAPPAALTAQAPRDSAAHSRRAGLVIQARGCHHGVIGFCLNPDSWSCP